MSEHEKSKTPEEPPRDPFSELALSDLDADLADLQAGMTPDEIAQKRRSRIESVDQSIAKKNRLFGKDATEN